MTGTKQDREQMTAIFRQTYPLFKDVKSEVIGNVLSRLTAGWLMGYKSKDQESTDLLRLEMLMGLIMGVIDMVEDLRERKTDQLH